MSEFKNVDGDWKSRAEHERKRLQEKLDREAAAQNLPPASFMTIISTFATQAMIALGEAEIPGVEGRSVDLPGARFAIDSLAVLQEKTKGNLDEHERKSLEDVLRSLRLRFVNKAKEPGASGKSDIVTP